MIYFQNQRSITEVEVIVSVSIIFSLTKESTNGVKSSWDPDHSQPDSASEINEKSFESVSTNSTIEEMEKPLLGGVRSVMPDITSSETTLLIEVFFSVPSSILHLWDSKTFSIGKSHILHVTMTVVLKTTSYSNQITNKKMFVFKKRNAKINIPYEF